MKTNQVLTLYINFVTSEKNNKERNKQKSEGNTNGDNILTIEQESEK